MPGFTRTVTGLTEYVSVPDDLADFYRARPEWVEAVVVDDVPVPLDEEADARAALEERIEVEQQVAELKGADLQAAVRAAKIDHPSALTADEKRAALAERKLAGADESGEAGNHPTKES